jgi:hypothetical protein
MRRQTLESVYGIIGSYGRVTPSFLEEQAEWLGISKTELSDCVHDLQQRGDIRMPSGGQIEAVKQ